MVNSFLSVANAFLDYIGHMNSIRTGPVFLTRDGQPMYRTYISGVTKPVCKAEQLTDGRANSKGLWKLSLLNRAVIENNVALLVEQAIKQEQFSIGWEETR